MGVTLLVRVTSSAMGKLWWQQLNLLMGTSGTATNFRRPEHVCVLGACFFMPLDPKPLPLFSRVKMFRLRARWAARVEMVVAVEMARPMVEKCMPQPGGALPQLESAGNVVG